MSTTPISPIPPIPTDLNLNSPISFKGALAMVTQAAQVTAAFAQERALLQARNEMRNLDTYLGNSFLKVADFPTEDLREGHRVVLSAKDTTTPGGPYQAGTYVRENNAWVYQPGGGLALAIADPTQLENGDPSVAVSAEQMNARTSLYVLTSTLTSTLNTGALTEYLNLALNGSNAPA